MKDLKMLKICDFCFFFIFGSFYFSDSFAHIWGNPNKNSTDISSEVNQNYKCHNVGDKRVIYDESCTIFPDRTLGCDAENQGKNCRFCGFSLYPACQDDEKKVEEFPVKTIKDFLMRFSTLAKLIQV